MFCDSLLKNSLVNTVQQHRHASISRPQQQGGHRCVHQKRLVGDGTAPVDATYPRVAGGSGEGELLENTLSGCD